MMATPVGTTMKRSVAAALSVALLLGACGDEGNEDERAETVPTAPAEGSFWRTTIPRSVALPGRKLMLNWEGPTRSPSVSDETRTTTSSAVRLPRLVTLTGR